MAITKASAQTTVNSGVNAAAAATVNEITTAPATATTVAGGGTLGGVTISNVAIMSNAFANASVLSGDTAVSSAGGFVRVTGTGFKTAANVLLGSTALANTFVSSTQINATIPATAAGTYQFTVFNTDGSGAISPAGLLISGPPSWTTTSYTSGSLTLDIQLLASGDAPLTYYIQPGSANPQNLTVNATGYLSGTVSAEGSYTVTVVVDDAQGQSTQAGITTTITLSDPYFNLTTLALPADTSANVWIRDASTNNFSLTVNGDTRPTAFSPYDTVWSNYFNGSSYLSYTYGSELAFGSGNFTVEFWLNSNSTVHQGIMQGDTNQGWGLFVLSGTFYWQNVVNQSNGLIVSVAAYVTPGWRHWALVRSSGTLSLYIDGQLITSAADSTNYSDASGTFYIGYLPVLGTYINGYLSDLRIVKGTAVYTAAFTPPTGPLTAIANTVLLTCQNNRFIDNSTNNFTLTSTGTTSVSNFAPFVETDTTTGSGYFDGTGDDLTIPTNSAFTYSTGDFTIEMWVYITANPADYAYIYGQGPNSTASMSLYIQSGKFNIWNGSNIIAGATTYLLNTWYHVAISRSSTSLRLFLNGVQDGSVTNSSNITTGSTLGASIGRWAEIGDNRYFTGYISNVRVVKGTAVYTANFTPPASPLTAIANTSLLTLQYRIGENNNRFIDQSNLNHLITRNGNATQGSFSPFSQTGWSNYFDGTGDYLTVPNNAAFEFGSGNFTIEFWAFPQTNPTETLPVARTFDGAGYSFAAYFTSGTVNFLYNNLTTVTGTATLSLNTWSHIAYVRNSNTLTIYVNGTSAGSGSISASITSSARVTSIGAREDGNFPFNGYISNLRVIKGTALYTATFTPSTTPLTAIANTSLLTCQSNRFVDNSTNAFAITRNGDVSVQAFSPFAPTTEYVPATHGGSGYFDGTGDYIVTPANSVFSLPGDFTLECWIYSVATQGQYAAVLCNINTTDGFYFSFSNSSNNMGFSNYGTYFISSSSTPIVNNVWTHIALTRSGTTLRMFFNGEIVGTGTSAANFGSSVSGTTVGFNGVNHFFNGYVSNARIVKGTAVYTAAFTPPTAPVTATANTSLLLNFTNAGIVDATGKNILETVNQAQLSTAVKKFGSASIVLDGVDDYVVMPYSPLFNLGTGAFTIEGWVYFNVLSGNRMIFDTYTSAALGGGYQLYWRSTGTSIALYGNGVVIAQSSFTGHATGTWYHIACTRDTAGNVRIFVDGTKYADTPYTTALNIATTARPAVGIQVATLTNDLDGYIDDFRLTVGYARYTANFTPPTSSFFLR